MWENFSTLATWFVPTGSEFFLLTFPTSDCRDCVGSLPKGSPKYSRLVKILPAILAGQPSNKIYLTIIPKVKVNSGILHQCIFIRISAKKRGQKRQMSARVRMNAKKRIWMNDYLFFDQSERAKSQWYSLVWFILVSTVYIFTCALQYTIRQNLKTYYKVRPLNLS